jgi:hypothetical protein
MVDGLETTEPRRAKDLRQFGRRQTIWHAWVLVAGRPALACIVRNISPTGALLEFPDGAPVAPKFELIIDYMAFSSACEVRHRSHRSAGVYFPLHVLPTAEPDVTPTRVVVAEARRALLAE